MVLLLGVPLTLASTVTLVTATSAIISLRFPAPDDIILELGQIETKGLVMRREMACGLDLYSFFERKQFFLILLVFPPKMHDFLHELVDGSRLILRLFATTLHPEQHLLLQVVIICLQECQILLSACQFLLALSQLFPCRQQLPTQLLIILMQFLVLFLQQTHLVLPLHLIMSW